VPEERSAGKPVEPRLSQQLAELREKVEAGTHHGESFELAFTETELEETLAWYAEKGSHGPFREARVRIDSDGVELSGEVRLGTLQLRVTGRADVYLSDGVPQLTVGELSIGKARLPDVLRFQLEDQLNRQLILGEGELPLVVREIDLREGRLTLLGDIR
jgi:uncharacterized protein YpmS